MGSGPPSLSCNPLVVGTPHRCPVCCSMSRLFEAAIPTANSRLARPLYQLQTITHTFKTYQMLKTKKTLMCRRHLFLVHLLQMCVGSKGWVNDSKRGGAPWQWLRVGVSINGQGFAHVYPQRPSQVRVSVLNTHIIYHALYITLCIFFFLRRLKINHISELLMNIHMFFGLLARLRAVDLAHPSWPRG